MAMDLDMALGSSEGPDLIMALVVIQATQLGMVPATARSLDTNMATGGGPDSGHLCGLCYQHEPWKATQTLPEAGPQTQI